MPISLHHRLGQSYLVWGTCMSVDWRVPGFLLMPKGLNRTQIMDIISTGRLLAFTKSHAHCFLFFAPDAKLHLLWCYPVILIVVNQWMKNDLSEIFEHAQLFGGTWPGAYSALCFSCGYFAYDQWDMLHYRLYSGWIPSILVHHLILLVCFTLALYRNVTINYLILTLICEVFSNFMLTMFSNHFHLFISELML